MKTLVIFSLLLLAACQKGDPGTVGPQGAVGSSGNGLSLSSIRNCNNSITNPSSVLFIYEVDTFSSGDKFVYCYISGSATSAYKGQFYRSSEVGATNEGCLVGFDLDAASSGFWTFSSNSGSKAVYSDIGSASNGLTVNFGTSNCTTF